MQGQFFYFVIIIYDPMLIVKRMDPSLLNSPEMTAQIIGNKPNTYTFTKVTLVEDDKI